MTQEQKEAVQRWIDALQPPSVALSTIWRKFERLNLSVEGIDADREAKVKRLLP